METIKFPPRGYYTSGDGETSLPGAYWAEQIKAIQRLVGATESGIYDSKTVAKVKGIQTSGGTSPTGLFSERDLKTIRESLHDNVKEQNASVTDLSSMTVKELRKLAGDLLISYDSRTRKADLIALIQDNSRKGLS